MILRTEKGEEVNTAFVSKQSKINFKVIEVHSGVLVPLLIWPMLPFPFVGKICLCAIIAMILLERRGWTIGYLYRRFRRWTAGPYRTKTSPMEKSRLGKY